VTYILGLNAYHGDSSACLVKDGVLIAAVEEERFRRIKHWAGFPSKSIEYCLSEAGITLSDVDHIAINQDAKANLWKKIGFTLAKRPELSFVLDRLKKKGERVGVLDELTQTVAGEFKGELHQIEHHLAHLSSAFHVSPFEKAVIVSVDGFGDFASAAWGVGSGTSIDIEDKVYFPHSLGIFYQALTQWLGFPNYGDEYKVMGLAPYGQPTHMDAMRKIVLLQKDGSFKLNLDFFKHHQEKVSYEWENGEPVISELFSPALVELLGPVRLKGEDLSQYHKDIARSIQAMYEEAFFHLLNTLHKKQGIDNLCLAGGCAMNSVANGRVYANTPFKKVYVQSAAGDAGGAIGAAYSVWHEEGGERGFVMDHSYWGPHFDNAQFEALLSSNEGALKEQACECRFIESEEELCLLTARAITEGKVIGWFQNRMEWGPRALGNRSI
jgi:carbamoyltransferase